MTIQFRGYNGKSEMQEAREPSLRMTCFGSVAISPLLLFAFEEGGGLEGAEDAGGQGSFLG